MSTKTRTKKTFSILSSLISFVFVIFLPVFFSCVSAPISQTDDDFLKPNTTLWKKFGENSDIEFFTFRNGKIKYHCAKINLQNKKLKILAYPNADSDNQDSIKFRKFIRHSGAKIAMNTNPYMKSGKIIGVHIADGTKISQESKMYSALIFKEEDEGFSAKIIETQEEKSLENAKFAFGGAYAILKNGKEIQFKNTSYDARSAAGISADGRTLYLLSAEKYFFKRGLSYQECAEILKNLGAADALEFDGGSSTSFFLSGEIRNTEIPRKNPAYMGFSF
ncbi:MAG: phosphodiester glycosidase family protein [Treponema sp.]|nr:phosphodiester glycosidase family protein [Treponema sp.]